MNQQSILLGRVQSTPYGIAISDSQHHKIFDNPQYYALWGESAQRLQQMSRQELYCLKLTQLANPKMDAHLLRGLTLHVNAHDKVHLKLRYGR